MSRSGKSTKDLAESAVLDEVVGNYQTATVRTPVNALSAQLAGEGPIADRLNTMDAQITSGNVLKTSWLDLLSVVPDTDGTGGEVLLEDTGTHLDATATGYDGDVVPNTGLFSWIAAWGRWAYLGETGVSSKANTFDVRNATNTAAGVALGDGAVFLMAGLPYKVKLSATGADSCTNDIGQDGVVPAGEPQPEHFGYVGDNSVSDRDKIAAWIAAGGIAAPVYLGTMGQSNMNGITDQVGGSMVIPDNLFVWDGNEAAGSLFYHAEVGEHPLDMTDDGGVTYSNNMALAMAREVTEREGRPVFLTQHAKGSHPIENFLPDAVCTANGWSKTLTGGFVDFGAFMYTDQAAALAAMPDAPSTFTDFAINLGEANADDAIHVLKAKMVALLQALTDAGVIDNRTRVLWSELPDGVTKSEHRIKFLVALGSVQCDFPNLRIIRTDGLDMFDGLHITGDDLDTLGQRYYEARISTPQEFQTITIDETFTPEFTDGTTAATLGSSTGHAHITFQRVYDDNGRPLGIGGSASIYMSLSNIDTTGLTGGDEARFSWADLTVGNGGNFAVESRAGGAGQRNGTVSVQKVAFGGSITAITSTDFAKIQQSQSGVLRTNLKVSDFTSGDADVAMAVEIPLLVI